MAAMEQFSIRIGNNGLKLTLNWRNQKDADSSPKQFPMSMIVWHQKLNKAIICNKEYETDSEGYTTHRERFYLTSYYVNRVDFTDFDWWAEFNSHEFIGNCVESPQRTEEKK